MQSCLRQKYQQPTQLERRWYTSSCMGLLEVHPLLPWSQGRPLVRAGGGQSRMEVPSIGGARYVIAVTDMSTCYHTQAEESCNSICHIILSMPETHCPLTLHTDGSGKFFNALICGSTSRGFCILLHHHTPQSTTVSQSTFCTL